jgi:hypothetical protein
MSGHTGWARLLGADPVPGLLAAGEPAARWVTRTAVLGQPADHPEVVADHGEASHEARAAAGVEPPAWPEDFLCGAGFGGDSFAS